MNSQILKEHEALEYALGQFCDPISREIPAKETR
jgi:hypothetical protein